MNKKRIKTGILLLYVIFISYLGRELYLRYRWNISGLPHQSISFAELPQKVKDFFYDTSDFEDEYGNVKSLVCIDNPNRYVLEIIRIGPWTDYEKIIDNQKKNYYRIDYGYPYPYIIYHGYLFIFNDWDDYYKWKEKEYSSIKLTQYKLRE